MSPFDWHVIIVNINANYVDIGRIIVLLSSEKEVEFSELGMLKQVWNKSWSITPDKASTNYNLQLLSLIKASAIFLHLI